MNGSSKKYFLLFSVSLYCLAIVSSSVSARNIFNIRHVNKAYAIKNHETGEHDRVCVGEVFFEDVENGIKFFCDSAYEHVETGIIEAFGKVLINQNDTLNIKGEYMSYNQQTDFVKMRKNTILEHTRATLYTDSLDYDMQEGVGYYNHGGKLVDSLSTLRSRTGIYYTDREEALFKQNVVITGKDYTIKTNALRYWVKKHEAKIIAPTYVDGDTYNIYTEAGTYNTTSGLSNFTKATRIVHEEQTLTGDLLEHNSKNGITILRNNCNLRDTVNNVYLYSNYIQRNEQDKTVLFTDNIEMQYVMDTDTLFAHSDTILLEQKEEKNEMLKIFHHVKFYKTDFQGVCDSMTFVAKDSLLNMYNKPVLWSGENQLTADTIIAVLRNETLDYIDLKKNAFIVALDSREKNYYNQMKGRNMRGFVKQDTLRTIEVSGNGEAIYFMKEDLEYIGFNSIRCSDITVRLAKGKLDEICFKVAPTGVTYPMSYAEKTPLFLRGFRWEEANRPYNREQIFSWRNAIPLDFKKRKTMVITEDDDSKEKQTN